MIGGVIVDSGAASTKLDESSTRVYNSLQLNEIASWKKYQSRGSGCGNLKCCNDQKVTNQCGCNVKHGYFVV